MSVVLLPPGCNRYNGYTSELTTCIPCKSDHLVPTDAACCTRHFEHDEKIGSSVVEIDRENRSVCVIRVPIVESDGELAVPTSG